GHVGMVGPLVMHLEVLVGAVWKQLRAAGPEVRERGDELLGRRGGRRVEVDGGHASSFPRASSDPIPGRVEVKCTPTGASRGLWEASRMAWDPELFSAPAFAKSRTGCGGTSSRQVIRRS